MKNIRKITKRRATFIEYAMLVGLVAIIVAIAALVFGKELKALFTSDAQKTHDVTTETKKADLKNTVDVTVPEMED